MTGGEILGDLYGRLTSRRFLLTLVSVGAAFWQYQLGALKPVEFQTAVVAAVTAYLLSEGITDAAGALRKTAPDQVVSVDASTKTAESQPAPPTAPYSPDYDEDAYLAALATVHAEEAEKRRQRDAKRRMQRTPLTEPVVQTPAPVRRPRPRPDVGREYG